MPQYVFHCQECGKEFTAFMHITDLDEHKAQCPHCGSRKVEQLVTAFSAVTSKKS